MLEICVILYLLVNIGSLITMGKGCEIKNVEFIIFTIKWI